MQLFPPSLLCLERSVLKQAAVHAPPTPPHPPTTIRSPELQPHQCISSREQTAMDLAASAIDGAPNGEGRHLVAV
jgi:hypothetical protein